MDKTTVVELPCQGDDSLTSVTLYECDEMETDGVSEVLYVSWIKNV